MIYLGLTLIFVLVYLNFDKAERLQDVENDLKLMLGDFLVARDLSEGRARVHYQATVVAVKKLIKDHFKEL